MERKLTEWERIKMQNFAAMMMNEMPKHRHEYKSEDLPLEDFDPFCMAPVDLQKIMNTLSEDLGLLDGIAVTANRFSERYMSVSRQLEKLVRQVGSMFLTFAVLEKDGYRVQYPEGLSIGKLYDIAGYHFNKAHLAVKGTQLYNLRFYLGMLAQEARWAVLLGRLNATEEKIDLIREGKIVISAEKQKSGKTRLKAEENNADPVSGPLKAAGPAALPVCRDVLSIRGERTMPAPQKNGEAEFETEGVQTSEASASGTEPLPEAEVLSPDVSDKSSEEETAAEEEELKWLILADEAEQQGDTKEFERVCTADSKTRELLWQDFMERERKRNYSFIKNCGYEFMRYGEPPPEWVKEAFGCYTEDEMAVFL